MEEDMLNKTIGRYQVKELIGEGAMAKVYRAFDPEINRSVAFKILKEDHCVDEEYLSRFLREAKAAGALSHSGIVTVFDVGKIEKSPYIMMELLDGRDLGEVLKENKTLPLKQTLIIAIQLAKSLDYAHKSGIVHRDIKPDNIIVMPDGESIKVADFGIARMNESEEAQKTQVGSVLGTPRYMSPEQALGNPVDGRTDLFSVGAIIYEMLSGKKAFDAGNMATLMMQIAQKQPEPLKSLCPDLPAGVRQIVQKLLQKSPDKRFQTGYELAEALGKELAALYDQQVEQKKHKYIPLKIRWTLSVGAIVALVSFISINIVFNMQSSAMTKQAVDSGASFAKFISTETAIPILSEDWITLDTFIADAASRDTFSYLIVTDRAGIVRGASDADLVGKAYQPNKNAELISQTEDVHTTSSETPDGRKMFNIRTPILFQSTEVGQIILGLSQDGLDEVKSITGWLMFILALVTTSSVAVVMFIFGGLIARPFKVLKQSLAEFAAGNLDSRISLKRNDEIGEVFDAFNSMAADIQDRYTEVTDELAQTGIDKGATIEPEPEPTTAKKPAETKAKSTAVKSNKTAETSKAKATKPATSKSLAKSQDKKPNAAQDAPPVPAENADQTIISNSQLGLDKSANQAKKSKLDNQSDSPQDADQTIISDSQIGLKSSPEQKPLKTQPDAPVADKKQPAETAESPDQTIISTSQVGLQNHIKATADSSESETKNKQQNTKQAQPKTPSDSKSNNAEVDKKPITRQTKSATAQSKKTNTATKARKPSVKAQTNTQSNQGKSPESEQSTKS